MHAVHVNLYFQYLATFSPQTFFNEIKFNIESNLISDASLLDKHYLFSSQIYEFVVFFTEQLVNVLELAVQCYKTD